MAKLMNFTNSSIPVATALNKIANINYGGLDLQPSYQRGYVWNDDFKDKLIYSVIMQYPIGNISVRVLEDANVKGAKEEVVDGQQRLTTIRDFVNNEYIIKSEWSKRIIEAIVTYFGENKQNNSIEKLSKKLSNKGKVHLKYSDLPVIIQGNIQAYNIAMTYIANASDEQVREYFRFLQNQERLRAGEIINSMPATHLESFLSDISDKEKFLNVIGFCDNRAEFDKVFYSIIGLFDGKLSFGSTDKTIQSYAATAKMPTQGLERTKRMVEQINYIASIDLFALTNARKRFVKYLLLLCGLGCVDFSVDTSNKLKELKKIDDKLSVFFSAKANVVTEEYSEYNADVVSEMRLIALLSKGGHSLMRVENRLNMLAYYVNNSNEKNIPSNISLIEE